MRRSAMFQIAARSASAALDWARRTGRRSARRRPGTPRRRSGVRENTSGAPRVGHRRAGAGPTTPSPAWRRACRGSRTRRDRLDLAEDSPPRGLSAAPPRARPVPSRRPSRWPRVAVGLEAHRRDRRGVARVRGDRLPFWRGHEPGGAVGEAVGELASVGTEGDRGRLDVGVRDGLEARRGFRVQASSMTNVPPAGSDLSDGQAPAAGREGEVPVGVAVERTIFRAPRRTRAARAIGGTVEGDGEPPPSGLKAIALGLAELRVWRMNRFEAGPSPCSRSRAGRRRRQRRSARWDRLRRP